jgi:putative endonuclease
MHDLSNRARGRWGEARAAAHLRSLGFAIIDRNWRPPERELRGDIDLVARGDDVIVFCEVKARRSSGFGGAAAAVDDAKRRRIRALASSWLREHDGGDAGLGELDVRFDVIAIDGVALTHHPSAF